MFASVLDETECGLILSEGTTGGCETEWLGDEGMSRTGQVGCRARRWTSASVGEERRGLAGTPNVRRRCAISRKNLGLIMSGDGRRVIVGGPETGH
jgi:hypothetical protein